MIVELSDYLLCHLIKLAKYFLTRFGKTYHIHLWCSETFLYTVKLAGLHIHCHIKIRNLIISKKIATCATGIQILYYFILNFTMQDREEIFQ